MGPRFALAATLACMSASPARATEPYRFAGIYSVLGAEFEKHYERTKFLRLASFTVQRADGSHTTYHIDTRALGEGQAAQVSKILGLTK